MGKFSVLFNSVFFRSFNISRFSFRVNIKYEGFLSYFFWEGGTITMDESYKRFKEMLDSRELTPYKVHKGTGIATSTLSDWQNGKSIPKDDKMRKIADFLDVSYDYLATGEDREKYSIGNAKFNVAVAKDKQLQRMLQYLMKLDASEKDMVEQMLKGLAKNEYKNKE